MGFADLRAGAFACLLPGEREDEPFVFDEACVHQVRSEAAVGEARAMLKGADDGAR